MKITGTSTFNVISLKILLFYQDISVCSQPRVGGRCERLISYDTVTLLDKSKLLILKTISESKKHLNGLIRPIYYNNLGEFE